MKSISFVMGHEGAILAVGLPPCNSKRQIFQQKSKKLLDLDLDVHAGRQVELHQSINRLIGRVDDVRLDSDRDVIPRVCFKTRDSSGADRD
jgi:hypothetical protein